MQAAVRCARACRQQLRAPSAPLGRSSAPGGASRRCYYGRGDDVSVGQGLALVGKGLRSVAIAIGFAGAAIAVSLIGEGGALGECVERGLAAHGERVARGRETEGVAHGSNSMERA